MTNCLGFPQLPPTPGLFPHSSLGWLHPPEAAGSCPAPAAGHVAGKSQHANVWDPRKSMALKIKSGIILRVRKHLLIFCLHGQIPELRAERGGASLSWRVSQPEEPPLALHKMQLGGMCL